LHRFDTVPGCDRQTDRHTDISVIAVKCYQKIVNERCNW